MQIRTTKTASGKTAVQVVERYNHKTNIVKHIGSAEDRKELNTLFKLAQEYITSVQTTIPLFPELLAGQKEKQHLVAVENLVFTKTYHYCAYEFFSFFYTLLGFHVIQNSVLKDLAIIRLIEPVSKRASVELLKEYFDITYGHTTLYNELKNIHTKKETIEEIAVSYAKKHLGFDFSLVFYDVTTLYFETFKNDEDIKDEKGVEEKGFRKPGFSKDNKANQPQIVIGLIVTKEGFPVSYEIFAGNTFEGKTFIPTICKFKKTYNVKNLTVVADAAMISYPNVQDLITHHLSYIVGARMASLKQEEIEQINIELLHQEKDGTDKNEKRRKVKDKDNNDKDINGKEGKDKDKDVHIKELKKKDGISMRIETERGTLICDFSFKRYLKDKREMDKQIAKAKKLLERNEGMKRTKFIKNKDDKKTEQILNTDLIEKTKRLLGVKGYYTNLMNETDKTIIDHYHDLWHVEKAFRIAKSDLEARPIFHHKKENIEVHIGIVFVSLCLAKSIELISHLSINRVKMSIWQILDIEFRDSLTDKVFLKRMDTTKNKMMKLWTTLQHEY